MKTFGRPGLCIYEYIKRLCKELQKKKPSKCPHKSIESCFYRPLIVIKFLSHWTSVTAIYYALPCWQLVDRNKKRPRCEIRAKSQGGREGESRIEEKLWGPIFIQSHPMWISLQCGSVWLWALFIGLCIKFPSLLDHVNRRLGRLLMKKSITNKTITEKDDEK